MQAIENEVKIFIKNQPSYDKAIEIFKEIYMQENGEMMVVPFNTKTIERYRMNVNGEKVKFRIVTIKEEGELNLVTGMTTISPEDKPKGICVNLKEKVGMNETVVIEKILFTNSQFICDTLLDFAKPEKVFEGDKERLFAELPFAKKDSYLELALDYWLSGPSKGLFYFELETDNKDIDILREVYRIFPEEYLLEVTDKKTMKIVKHKEYFRGIIGLDAVGGGGKDAE